MILKVISFVIVLAVSALSCDRPSPLEGHYTGGRHNEETSDVEPQEEPEPAEGVKKILFIGNSLTLDATMLLPSLLNSAGVDNIELYRTFHGAYTIPLYQQNWNSTTTCSFCSWKPGWARWRGQEVFDHSPAQAVSANEYDIVCIQEYPHARYPWKWNSMEKAMWDDVIGKIYAAQKTKPEIVFLFAHTHGKRQERVVTYFGGESSKQFEAFATEVASLLEQTEVSRIVSPAAVVQNLRTSPLNVDNGKDLTRGDDVHADYGLTRFAEAALLFKTLITPLCGKKIEDNPYRLEEYYPHPTIAFTPVTDANLPTILKAVDYAIAKPLEVTDMSSEGTLPAYEHKAGSVMLDEGASIPEACSFPVVFPVGSSMVDSYKQPFWSGYGIWVCNAQPQAFGKWVSVSNPLPGYMYTRTFANSDAISSVALRGMWTGDYFEFSIPVKDFKAGTKVEFTAPFYTRQGPVFWEFEWLDGGIWKNNNSSISSLDDSFTMNASFAIKAGTTIISQVASFDNEIAEGYLRFRIKVADGSIQADSASLKAVKRDAPNHTDADYSSVFYFYGTGDDTNSLKFNILKK